MRGALVPGMSAIEGVNPGVFRWQHLKTRSSIGVLGGKLLTKGFWEKLGITYDDVHTSENGTMFTGAQDYTPKEWAKFQQWLDRVYSDFTSKVADGRKLPKAKVLEIAKGRIWTGEDALGLGLVDREIAVVEHQVAADLRKAHAAQRPQQLPDLLDDEVRVAVTLQREVAIELALGERTREIDPGRHV